MPRASNPRLENSSSLAGRVAAEMTVIFGLYARQRLEPWPVQRIRDERSDRHGEVGAPHPKEQGLLDERFYVSVTLGA